MKQEEQETPEVQSVITGASIPKDLQKISGLNVGFKPVLIEQSRLVISGQPGTGKSTLLNGCSSLLMLDPEGGGNTVAVPNALRFTAPPSVPPEDLDKAYINLVDKIIARRLRGKEDIQIIGIDTIDEMIDIFLVSLCLRNNIDDPLDLHDGSGNGYTIVRKALFGMLDKIHRAGMGWAIIAHTVVKTIRMGKEERQVTRLAASDSFQKAIFQKCEHMLFIERGIKTITPDPVVRIVKGEERRKPQRPQHVPCRKLKTEPGGLWAGGDASDIKVRIPLPKELVLPEREGFSTLTKAYDKAIKTLTEKTDGEQ